MKNWIQLARISVTLLAGCFSLAWLTGCESLQDTSFAPLDARLEPIPGGGAQHFVVVNTSGQVLHNFRFRAYMWDDRAITYTAGNNSPLPKRLPAMTYTFMGSGSQWEPGHVQRFRDRDLNSEISILKPVSRVQIVGSCDEGRFREDWQVPGFGQLQRMGRVKGRKAHVGATPLYGAFSLTRWKTFNTQLSTPTCVASGHPTPINSVSASTRQSRCREQALNPEEHGTAAESRIEFLNPPAFVHSGLVFHAVCRIMSREYLFQT